MNYENEDGITIETPVPGRYTITGFRAATVYVPDVGHLAPPPNIDLPMSPAIAAALRAVLDDYEPAGVIATPEPTPAPQLTFQERVIKEKEELEEKAEKLSDFIGNNPIFEKLPPDEQERMKVQNDVMWQYVEVLDARIAAFNPLPVSEQSAPEKPRRGGRRKASPVETSTEGGQE